MAYLKKAIYPESGPVSSSIKFKFKQKNGQDLELYWMDGGITPERPDELEDGLNMNDALGDWPGENDFEGALYSSAPKEKFPVDGVEVTRDYYHYP